MGKSTAAEAFRHLGVSVYDSDAAVHHLFAKNKKTIDSIRRVFPETIQNGAIDRRLLGARVFSDKKALACLESIIHPLAAKEQNRFLAAAARRKEGLVLLNVPLLFEVGGDKQCDAVAVVTAPVLVQHRRALNRFGMTEEKLNAILSRQMSDKEKRRRADIVISTGIGKAHTLKYVTAIIKDFRRRQGCKWRAGCLRRSG